MNKYIKKPVEIEAIQWTGKNIKEVMKFIGSEFSYRDNLNYVTKKFSYYCTTNNLSINTLEGSMKANVNDYIIKGVNGEFYPCKPDIFEKTYDKTPTLEEVKKEWEEREWEWSRTTTMIYIAHLTKKKSIGISSNNLVKINGWLDLQELELLTKTFKALGWEM